MFIERLDSFLAATRFMNFTKAAESLFTSQSTFSRHISELEEYLGVTLFIRNNRTVKLTQAGEILLESAPDLLRSINHVISNVRQMGSGSFGSISLAIPNFYQEKIFDVIGSFQRGHPNISLSLHPFDLSPAETILLHRSEVIVALSYELPDGIIDMNSKVLFSGKFCIVTSKKKPVAHKKNLKLSDLSHERFIFVNRQSTYITRDLMKRVGHDDNPPLFAEDSTPYIPDTLESLLFQVRTGAGVALIPRFVAEMHSSGITILDPEDLDLTFDVLLLWIKKSENPSMKMLVDTFLSAFCP